MEPAVEYCYMCGAVATTVEHAPPKCLFPEAKDTPGADFRKNLITVPSCIEHNCSKSSDDEFLMVSIAGIVGNNSIGYHHATGKVDRALRRSSYRLLNKVFHKKEILRIEKEDNEFIDFIIGTPDYARLKRCFNSIAYAIYRHHFGHRFIGESKAQLGFLHSTDKNPRAFNAFIKHKVALELAGEPEYGENRRVFYYQFTKPDVYGIFLLKMCFYEGVDVYHSFIPSTSEKPYLLTMDLIEHGIKSYINLDGKTYEFN